MAQVPFFIKETLLFSVAINRTILVARSKEGEITYSEDLKQRLLA